MAEAQHKRTYISDEQRRPGYTLRATTVIAVGARGAVCYVNARGRMLDEKGNL